MRYRAVLLFCLILIVASVAPGLAREYEYFYYMDSDPGWAMTGEFGFGSTTTSGACISAACCGTSYVGTSAVTCAYSPSTTSTLTSPALDCRGLTGVTLRFGRNLGLAEGDSAMVEVSNDGSTWHPIWSAGHDSGDYFDGGWVVKKYDISYYADGRPTVYVRWSMTSDAACSACVGFNIDNVFITAEPLEVLAWVPYVDTAGAEYTNAVSILQSTFPRASIHESTTLDPATLQGQLRDKHVLLLAEQELATVGDLTAAGAAFAGVLDGFVRGGGTVVACSETSAGGAVPWYGFLTASGLMNVTPARHFWTGETLTVTGSAGAMGYGLSGTSIASQNSTAAYRVGPETNKVLVDTEDNAVVAERMLGAGAVVLIGFDYYTYDADAAQFLINAVRYPMRRRTVLLYENDETAWTGLTSSVATDHVARRALGRLHAPCICARSQADDFNAWLTSFSDDWDAVVVEAPNAIPTGGWDALAAHAQVTDGEYHPTLLSTWSLTSQTNLANAFGVVSNGTLGSLPALYDWAPTSLAHLFDRRDDVPSPIDTWRTDIWTNDGDRLSATGPGTFLLAGFDPSSTATTEGAIAVGNCASTIINGFLWSNEQLDDDVDDVQDVEELVTNQLSYLLSVPDPYPAGTASEIVTGQSVDFSNNGCDYNVCCYKWWPEADFSGLGCPWLGGTNACDVAPITGAGISYTYTEPGFYFPVLEAANRAGYRRMALPVAVGFPDAGPSLNSFRPIIACVEAGVVKGFGDGTYKPTQDVKRDAMAVYIARALCGGEDNVPIFGGTPSFSDVDPSSWALNHIEYCYANNVVTGFSGGTYAPGWLVNRGQMAAYIARAISDPAERPNLPSYTPPVTPDFPDVATDYSYYKYIEYLYQNDIVTGFGDGTYGPTRTVTRGQMAIYIQRAFGYETYD